MGGLGIRTAREANSSLLGKLVWDLQQEKDKLWVHLLRHKYNVRGNFLNYNSKAGSPTWGAISKAKNILQGGFELRIGKGNLSFWFDHWLDPGPLHFFLPFIDIHDIDLKLNDLFVGGEWKLEQLYTSLPDHLTTFLKGSHLQLNPAVNDLYIWSNSPLGCYSTKSGYQWLLQQRRNTTPENSWSWIWKIPCQQNIRFFVWLAFNNSIPTLATLHYRGISSTADCRLCHGDEETLMHCLRDCPMVARLWRKLGFSDGNFFQQADTLAWLKQGAQGTADTLFLAGIWWVWKARNAKCFNDESIPFQRLLLAVLNLADSFKVCFKSHCSSINSPRQIGWYQGDHNGIILNVDGSSLGNPGPAGFGGLFRNADGGWIYGFNGHIGYSDVLKAELLGLLNGLKLAWDRGHRNLRCYTDSLNAKILIQGQSIAYHKYATIVQEVRDLLALPWHVDLQHTLREGNMCADHLAKMGAAGREKLRTFASPPPDLSVLLAGDAAGVTYPRGYPLVDLSS